MLPANILALILPLIAAAASVQYCDETVTSTIYSTTNIGLVASEPEPTTTASSTQATGDSTSATTLHEPVTNPAPTTIANQPVITKSSATSTSTTAKEEEQPTVAPLPKPFEFKKTYLAAHNRFRQLFDGTPDVTWNNDLEEIAQNLADKYTCDGSLSHSYSKYQGNSIGENLAYGYDFEKASSVTAWFNEITKYNYEKPGFSASTGHFTQVVWSETTEIGCGYKECSNDEYYVICEYNPAGNWQYAGDSSMVSYINNVHEPKNPLVKNGFNIDTLV